MERDTISFADQEIIRLIEKQDHFLKDIDKMIKWDKINKLLRILDFRRTSSVGQDSYPPETMFRIMLIQHWYLLSDYQAEEQLRMNIMFMWFCHISIGNSVPDHSTICRWRSRFSERGLFEKLLNEINKQMEEFDISVRTGTIVDATMVQSQARPRKKEIIETEPTGDEEIPEKQIFQPTNLNVSESKDPDAKWVKKGNKSTYGYKGHVATDTVSGIVQAVIVTPANKYDGHMLEEVVNQVNPKPNTDVLTDKGYDSEKNETFLSSRGLNSKIMHKKKKNQSVVREVIEANLAISKIRYKIEQSFGCLKKHFGWTRSIYIGLKKTEDYLLMGAIAFNLKRSLAILKQ